MTADEERKRVGCKSAVLDRRYHGFAAFMG
jgi:hypothetical protein